MVAKNRRYKVRPIGSGLKRSYPLHEVKPNTIVIALEDAPSGGLDVVDVRTSAGRVKSVYAFQLMPAKRK